MFAFFITAALLSVATATDVQNQLETARLPQATQRLEFGAEAFKFSFADLAKVRLYRTRMPCRLVGIEGCITLWRELRQRRDADLALCDEACTWCHPPCALYCYESLHSSVC
jgi:hypothetical protein